MNSKEAHVLAVTVIVGRGSRAVCDIEWWCWDCFDFKRRWHLTLHENSFCEGFSTEECYTLPNILTRTRTQKQTLREQLEINGIVRWERWQWLDWGDGGTSGGATNRILTVFGRQSTKVCCQIWLVMGEQENCQ